MWRSFQAEFRRMNHFISRRGEYVGHSDKVSFGARYVRIAYPAFRSLEREGRGREGERERERERETRRITLLFSRAKREIVPRFSVGGKIVDA